MNREKLFKVVVGAMLICYVVVSALQVLKVLPPCGVCQ